MICIYYLFITNKVVILWGGDFLKLKMFSWSPNKQAILFDLRDSPHVLRLRVMARINIPEPIQEYKFIFDI